MILVIRTGLGVLSGAVCGAVVLGLFFYLSVIIEAGGSLSWKGDAGEWALLGLLRGAVWGGSIGYVIGATNLGARWGGIFGAITGVSVAMILSDGLLDLKLPALAGRYTLMGLVIGLATALLLRLLWKTT